LAPRWLLVKHVSPLGDPCSIYGWRVLGAGDGAKDGHLVGKVVVLDPRMPSASSPSGRLVHADWVIAELPEAPRGYAPDIE
jgi:hypothetical protein